MTFSIPFKNLITYKKYIQTSRKSPIIQYQKFLKNIKYQIVVFILVKPASFGNNAFVILCHFVHSKVQKLQKTIKLLQGKNRGVCWVTLICSKKKTILSKKKCVSKHGIFYKQFYVIYLLYSRLVSGKNVYLPKLRVYLVVTLIIYR